MNISSPLYRPVSLALSLALALGTLQASAHAAVSADEIPAKSVDYSDLNLAKKADVTRLYGRITLAANTVCRPFDGKDAQRTSRFHHCVNDAVAQAVAQVDSPLLTQRYAAARREGILSPLVSRLNR